MAFFNLQATALRCRAGNRPRRTFRANLPREGATKQRRLRRKSRTARRSIPTLDFRKALPRQPREGGMAVPAVYDCGVETSSTQNLKIPCRACVPLAIEKTTGLRPQNVQPPRAGARRPKPCRPLSPLPSAISPRQRRRIPHSPQKISSRACGWIGS
jgi:hypothetical protein